MNFNFLHLVLSSSLISSIAFAGPHAPRLVSCDKFLNAPGVYDQQTGRFHVAPRAGILWAYNRSTDSLEWGREPGVVGVYNPDVETVQWAPAPGIFGRYNPEMNEVEWDTGLIVGREMSTSVKRFKSQPGTSNYVGLMIKRKASEPEWVRTNAFPPGKELIDATYMDRDLRKMIRSCVNRMQAMLGAQRPRLDVIIILRPDEELYQSSVHMPLGQTLTASLTLPIATINLGLDGRDSKPKSKQIRGSLAHVFAHVVFNNERSRETSPDGVQRWVHAVEPAESLFADAFAVMLTGDPGIMSALRGPARDFSPSAAVKVGELPAEVRTIRKNLLSGSRRAIFDQIKRAAKTPDSFGPLIQRLYLAAHEYGRRVAEDSAINQDERRANELFLELFGRTP